MMACGFVVGTNNLPIHAQDLDLNQLPPAANRVIDFHADIKPIFEQRCFQCHGPHRPKGGFRLDNAASAWRGGDSGAALIPGDSTNSYLIHLIAQLDPASVMPPEGEPLTAEQVGLLRAWIDQGAWWGKEQQTVSASLSPAVQITAVSGNARQFAEHFGQREGWRVGVESFSLTESLSPESTFSLSGHALTDDYRVLLLVDKTALGFMRLGFEQFREYYADTGGYFPLFSQPAFSLNRDLHHDIGRAGADFGLTIPDWPRVIIGYEYQFRHGDKSTLQWGAVTEGAESRAIFPNTKSINERTHIVKVELTHDIAGWQFSDSFRGEWTELNTRRENISRYTITTPTALIRDDVRESWKLFQGANTFRVERAFRDWLYASGGYLYSHLSADADFSLDQFNPGGAPVSDFIQRSEWRSQRIVLERESHVGNLNLLLGPWQQSTLNFGVQGEVTEQNGTIEGTQTDFIAPPFNGPPFNVPDLVNPLSGITDIKRATVEETVALRLNRIPFTTLFAEARLQQEQLRHVENVLSLAAFNRNTEADTFATDVRVGFDTSPTSWLKFGSHYRWRDKTVDYDDGFENDAPADITGYPTFIAKREQTTHEIVSRLTIRPANWIKSTFTHRLIATDFRTTTEPLSLLDPGDGSPGGRTLTGNYDAHIFSLNITVTPTRRWHAFGTVSYHDTRSIAFHENPTAVAPDRGSTWSFLGNSRFVLTAKTDFTIGYTFSTANYRQNLLLDGLAVGTRYERHGMHGGLTTRHSEHLTTKLQYGFYHYDEPSTGGINDYTAHALFVSVHWLMP